MSTYTQPSFRKLLSRYCQVTSTYKYCSLSSKLFSGSLFIDCCCSKLQNAAAVCQEPTSQYPNRAVFANRCYVPLWPAVAVCMSTVIHVTLIIVTAHALLIASFQPSPGHNVWFWSVTLLHSLIQSDKPPFHYYTHAQCGPLSAFTIYLIRTAFCYFSVLYMYIFSTSPLFLW